MEYLELRNAVTDTLREMGGRAGTMQLSHYLSSAKGYSFEREVFDRAVSDLVLEGEIQSLSECDGKPTHISLDM